jgi:acyl-CoA synthetase
MGLGPARSYGMTECPSVTTPGGADPAAVRLGTDGPLPPGVECEAVDPDSRGPLAPGDEGELRVRGPERMLGYLDAEQTLAAVDADGWFYSGDLGLCDGRTVRVTGRIKDIINRGGEKFSASDIEAVLRGHDVVADAAVVAAPDARYGEVPVAFLVAREGAVPPDPSALSAWVLARGMAAQKTPARFSWVPELPTTPSGKVKKFELLAALPPAEEVQP